MSSGNGESNDRACHEFVQLPRGPYAGAAAAADFGDARGGSVCGEATPAYQSSTIASTEALLPALNALAARRRTQGVLPGFRDGSPYAVGALFRNSRLRHFQVAFNGIALAIRLLTND